MYWLTPQTGGELKVTLADVTGTGTSWIRALTFLGGGITRRHKRHKLGPEVTVHPAITRVVLPAAAVHPVHSLIPHLSVPTETAVVVIVIAGIPRVELDQLTHLEHTALVNRIRFPGINRTQKNNDDCCEDKAEIRHPFYPWFFLRVSGRR